MTWIVVSEEIALTYRHDFVTQFGPAGAKPGNAAFFLDFTSFWRGTKTCSVNKCMHDKPILFRRAQRKNDDVTRQQ